MKRLKDLIAPPARPLEAGPPRRRWAVEKALGTALPEGLCQFALAYGSGTFGAEGFSGLLTVYNPFSPAYVARVRSWIDTFRRYKRAESDKRFPYDLYPDRPGLLPCGSGERRALFWFVEGAPDEWPLVLQTPDDRFRRFEVPLAEFLVLLFSGEDDCYGGSLDAAWFRARVGKLAFRPAALPSR
jgi:hypothetical protein